MSLAAAIGRARARLPRRLTLSLRGLMGLVALAAVVFAYELQFRPRWHKLAGRAQYLEQKAVLDELEADICEEYAADATELADNPERIPTTEIIRMFRPRRLSKAVIEAFRKHRANWLRERAVSDRKVAAEARARAADHAAQARTLRSRWW